MKKRNYPIILILSILVALTTYSCYFDNAEELLVCFPEDVSYRMDVQPILETRCYECHDVTNAPALGDGIVLEGYSRLVAFLENNEDKLLGSIIWDGRGSPMPPNGTKLDNCSVSKIEVWIEEGTRNN